MPVLASQQPRVLASGRASDVFDLGDGRVLRRLKGKGDLDREARVMEHARLHGVPVPRVLDVRGNEMLMERVAGPTMLQDLLRRPWRFRRHASTLAALHTRIHAAPAPPGVPELGNGPSLLHLDVHPQNVVLSPRGPVLVDWTNARRGDADIDVALTWLIVMTSAPRVFRPFAMAFARAAGEATIAAGLTAAGRYRVVDPNVTDAERARVEHLTQTAY